MNEPMKPPAHHGAVPPAPPPPRTWTAPAWTPPTPPRRRARSMLSLALIGMLLLGSGVAMGWSISKERGDSATVSTGRTDTGPNVRAVTGRVNDAVVNIETFTDPGSLGGFGTGPGSTPLGAGTGMVVSSTGEVLTNNHVVEGATRIEATLAEAGTTYAATVVGADPVRDVALLQLRNASGLPTVSFGNSSILSVGEDVVALGNALGRGGSPSVTTGEVSALRRDITVSDGRGGSEHLLGLIQTNASISPGESGGPLTNAAGEVVGMITASGRTGLFPGTGGAGFAIPSNDALGIVRDIRAGDESSTIVIGEAGFIGVRVRPLTPDLATEYGLHVTQGALVIDAVQGMPAANAGIGEGSVVTSVDGTTVDTVDELGPLLHQHHPGDTVNVTWIDASGSHNADVTLVAGPAV